MQLIWGEPLAMVAERIERLKCLSAECDRARPLDWPADDGGRARNYRPGLASGRAEAARSGPRTEPRVRSATSPVAARSASAPARAAGARRGPGPLSLDRPGQGRHRRGSTWLVGSPDDVIASLEDYVALGMTHFILSDTPYLDEAIRVGDAVVAPMLIRARDERRASRSYTVRPHRVATLGLA